MLVRLWALLVPSQISDDEQRRVARAVRLLTVGVFVGQIPALYLQWRHGWMKEFWTLAGAGLIYLVVLRLNHQGRVQRAAETLTLATFASAACLAFLSGQGYLDVTLLVFPAILAVGALLLSWRFYVSLTSAVLAVVSAMVVIQIYGRNPNTTAKGDYGDLVMIVIVLALTSVAIGLLAVTLKRSLLKYQLLIQQQGEGVVVLDEHRRIQMANPVAAEILGMPPAQLYGRGIHEIVPAEEWTDTARCRRGERVSFELTGARPDGTRRRLLVTCTPRLADDGTWSESIAVIRDVTAHREADEKIRLMAHALRSTDNCVCISDVSQHIVYVNDAFLQTYGYAESELIGQHISIVGSSRNPPGRADGILPATLKDGWSGELWNRARDGREFPVSLTSSVVRDERGRVIATVGVARDLTERKAVEGALQELERRFRDLLEHGNVAAVTLDMQGRLTFCNDVVLAALNRSREDVQGRPALEFLAPEDRAQHLKSFRDAAQSGRPPSVTESALLGADGRRHWFQWNNTALRHPDGGPAGWACWGFEVTEQRALREQYLQAQKLESVGRLAAGVAHDFNNLLTVMNGFSKLMLEQLEPGSTFREYLEPILTAGDQAAALTGQLLAFSRKQVAQPKPLDLSQIIREARKLLSRVLGEDIEVNAQLSPGLRLVMADPHHMQQVLINLAINGRDAMPGGGRLTLSTDNLDLAGDTTLEHPGIPPGGYVHVVVADTGTGMSDEVQARIFEPFFTTKEKGRGTGLGLATVYGIVRQCGGWIRVQSEIGRGSAFHIYLPAINIVPHEEESDPTLKSGLSGTETILLVEDQAAVLRFVETTLKGYGYRVLSALSGPAAVSLAEQYRGEIHLLVTDLIMPVMDGKTLAGKFQELRPGTKVLFMTGYAGELLQSADPQGLQRNYLLKPLKPHILAAKIREVLAT
jgi:two-component system, cell cycle sensor histidine kinase and response regulator CckA